MPPRKRSKPVRSRTWRTVILGVANSTHSTPCEVRPHLRPARSESAILRKPPIHSLPLEVISEIFILALPADYELLKRSQMHPEDKPKFINPLVFCAVCSLWRSIALSTARLWKRAFVFLPQGIKKGHAKQKAAYLVRWIERSGSLPLTLHISSDDVEMSLLGTGPDAPVISVLNRYAARWETLYHHSMEDHQSTLFMLRAPRSQLSFGFAGWHSLRQIRSSHINNVIHEPNQTTPWAQLTDLQISAYMPTSRAMSIFRECPQLLRLSITVWSTEVHAFPIIQHGLVTLCLTTDHCSFLVQSISLPKLRNLYMSKLSTTHFGSLLGFFTRSSCNLDKLVISETYLTPRNHINLLGHKSCDSLSSLTFNDTWMGDVSVDKELVRRLTLHQHDSLCTRLKVLAMTCWIEAPTSALLNMVESRIGSHAGQPPDGLLQYLRLYVVFDEIQKLEEVGTRSGVECTHEKHGELDHVLSIVWRRQGFRERVPAAKFNGFPLDEL